ncbi:MAG: glycosyltransferase [Spirochaetia bacterium]|nr:glycosyltransferase [Spirochaetia bacterium]
MMIDAVLLIYSIFMVIVHLVIICGIVRACAISGKQRLAEQKKQFKVSVIIPAKDEADNLPALFSSLEKVMTPDVQVILADDRSVDQTQSLMNEFAARHSNVKVIKNTEPPKPGMNPKHSMLSIASRYADGDILMFTDADCIVPAGWVTEVSRYFQDPKVGLVFSAVVTAPGCSLRERYQTQDHLMRFFYTVGAVGLGNPSGGYGNNLAVRRTALEEIGGFDSIGFSLTEDAQLIAAVRNTGHWKVAVCPFRSVLVYAQPQKKLLDAAKQEVRWSAGAVFGGDRTAAFMYSFMLLFTLVGAISCLAIPFHPQAMLYYFAPVLSMIMMSLAGNWYIKMDKGFILWIVPCAFIGTLFYGFTFLTAFLIPSVSWKGVKIKK